MNYKELLQIAERKEILLKDVADILGLSMVGLRYTFNKNSLPAKKLPLLCACLRISLYDYFTDAELELVPKITEGEKKSPKKTILALEAQLQERENQISTLINLLEKKEI